ncbi:MAG: rRNA maturation RNase YbeY [Rikenellaceae bacterium]
MRVSYFNNDTAYRFSQRRLITRWLRAVAESEGYTLGDLGVIFCSSPALLELNREYLKHDYFTDIITFDSSSLDEGIASGELYIDVDTVADNAAIYESTPLREMHRILCHGVLHLCGQGDKSPEEAIAMRAKEDRALDVLDKL